MKENIGEIGVVWKNDSPPGATLDATKIDQQALTIPITDRDLTGAQRGCTPEELTINDLADLKNAQQRISKEGKVVWDDTASGE